MHQNEKIDDMEHPDAWQSLAQAKASGTLQRTLDVLSLV